LTPSLAPAARNESRAATNFTVRSARDSAVVSAMPSPRAFPESATAMVHEPALIPSAMSLGVSSIFTIELSGHTPGRSAFA
jgi:hypothetical protein